MNNSIRFGMKRWSIKILITFSSSFYFRLKKQLLIIRLLAFGFPLLLISGCASYGVIDNAPQKAAGDAERYSIRSSSDAGRSGDISLMLAFSGGGTRAAAFEYGVLEELRDTGVVTKGRSERLLDEVDFISSVSGGSFTAAYYGLYGSRIFDDFEEVFLRRNVEGKLIRGVLNPLEWFRRTGRTEMAVGYYEKNVFHGATFGDMKRKGGSLEIVSEPGKGTEAILSVPITLDDDQKVQGSGFNVHGSKVREK